MTCAWSRNSPLPPCLLGDRGFCDPHHPVLLHLQARKHSLLQRIVNEQQQYIDQLEVRAPLGVLLQGSWVWGARGVCVFQLPSR